MKILGIIILVIAILVILAYLFLIAPRMSKKPDRTPFYGYMYAHRGLFDNETEAPENSIPAFQKAVEGGFGIELDVQLSKDGIPVVFHDASLKRVCDIDGKVWEYTLEELQQMKLAKSQQTIPTFAQVLKIIDGKVPIIVEYKMDIVDTKVCEKGNELLKDYKGIYCIESFHPFAVKWYKNHRPDVLRGQLSMDFWKEEKNKGKKELLLVTHLLSNVLCRPDFIAYCHEDARMFSRNICRMMGALSVAWTIKSEEEYQKAKDKFDLFIFDSYVPKK